MSPSRTQHRRIEAMLVLFIRTRIRQDTGSAGEARRRHHAGPRQGPVPTLDRPIVVPYTSTQGINAPYMHRLGIKEVMLMHNIAQGITTGITA